ncbi:flagellar hook protein FlgE [Desulfatitalea alkaliphila]|uniref:Flagellar hook protein FlgE n=1 Tax=Desulfatitalea alkaliphila TaxID=2929485 RepID=A0AA41R5E2_9BACT|nr:flagellar hook protein FlgE [Desulfatitalea alkaliphila]MCJ8501305.1 flagellar hook protein FlgE [Desulfatitalea alkaliphila]
MIGSLYSGISGLKAQTSAMAVIGDNIANVNTTGFKTSKVRFANVFNATLGQSRMQIGRGVTMAGLTSNWGSGTIENTNAVTDLAINGQGMFIVRDGMNNAQYYTRAGQFEFNNLNRLVTTDGFEVQGYAILQNGNRGAMGPITLPNGISEPSATEEITMAINLDSEAEVGTRFDTTVTVYDSLGNAVELNFIFERDGDGWQYYVDPSLGTATPSDAARNYLRFDAYGVLEAANDDDGGALENPVIEITGINLGGVDPLELTWNLLNDAGTASSGSVTGYAGSSVKTAQSQDGYPSGMLQGISIDDDGTFTALYSNGTMRPFAQIALADFASYEGLAKLGSNLFTASLASGQPIVTTPNSAGVGAIASSSLEMSNVDLAQEFVSLITTQRAFQANSKVITTSDEVLAELINIKR